MLSQLSTSKGGLGFAAGGQGCNRERVLTDRRQQVCHIDLQRLGQPIQYVDRGIERALFDATHIGSIDVRIDGENLLGNAFGGPQSPEISSDACSPVHGAIATSLLASKPSNIFDIIRRLQEDLVLASSGVAIRLRTAALVTVLGSVLTCFPADAADIEVVASSILRAYGDYCDPMTADQLAGATDAAAVANYSRVLAVKYGGDCGRFYTEQVAPAIVVPALIESTPLLQRDAARTLAKEQLTLLGGARRLRDMMALECELDAKAVPLAEIVASQLEAWAPQLVRGDALDYAGGFVGFEQYARYIINVPAEMYLPQNCGYLEQVVQAVAVYMVNHGIPINEPTGAHASTIDEPRGTSSAEFEKWANAPTDDEIADLGQEASKIGGPSKEGSPIDAFGGRWGSTRSCDQPGSQYTIGRFDLADPERFGVGAARIQAADLSCQLSDIKSFGSTVTFEAECLGEGDTWSGTGSIQETAKGAINLFLFDAPEPAVLESCAGNSGATPTETTSVVPLDLGFGH